MFIKFADWFVYDLLNMPNNLKLAQSLHFFVYDTIKILFLLCSIIFSITFLRTYLNNQIIKRVIEMQPKFVAHLFASLFGAVTPFCSCSSIPIFIGFIEAGLPFGVAMSFIITSPMINEIAIVVLIGVIGIKITLLYLFTGIFVGIFGGMLMDKLGYSVYMQDYLNKLASQKNCNCACNCDSKNSLTFNSRFKYSFSYTKDLVGRIWIFVLIGVAFGALLHGYVPEEFFLKYLGKDNFFAVPFSVLCGIPLYSDVTTIIPIVQVLIQKGAAIGTVLVFMMSVVGLSLPEMIILSKVMKKELILRYAIFMFVTFTIIGYIYNLVI